MSAVEIVTTDSPNRVESGIVQFFYSSKQERDWNGVFLRGDTCFGYLMALRQVIGDKSIAHIARMPLIELAELLNKSNENEEMRNRIGLQISEARSL